MRLSPELGRLRQEYHPMMIHGSLTLHAPKRERASAVSSFRISLLRFEVELLVSSSVRCKHELEGRAGGERRSCQTGTNEFPP